MPLRDFSEAEIVLKARRRMEQPLLALVWLGVVMFSLWQENLWYLAAGSFGVLVNFVAVRRAKEVFVQRGFVNAGVLVATGILVLEVATRGGHILPKLGNYLILIQLCKLFEQKRNRDYIQMIALSMLLVIAASLFCSALWFAILLVVYGALACYTAMVFTLKRNLDRAAVAKLVNESGPLSPRRVAWNAIRDWPTGSLVRGTAVCILVILGVSALMFLAAPRQGATSGLLDLGGDDTVSGFAPSVQLGRTKQVYLSDRIVLTVLPRRVSPSSSAQPLYLRAKTFNHYSDSRWTSHARLPMRAATPPELPADLRSQAQELEISMEPELLPALFLPGGTVDVQADRGHWRLDADGGASLTHSQPLSRNARYRVWSFPAPRAPAQQARVDSVWNRRRPIAAAPGGWGGLGRLLGLRPAAPPRYRPPPSRVPRSVAELARQWCQDLLADAPGPGADVEQQDRHALALAHRIARGLAQRCQYTLDLSESDAGRDGVEDFLFHTKKGHCEYFAAALTVMCQSLGVDARLATGFLVDGPLRVDNRLFVRSQDAHAWTEVRTQRGGWVVVDATPSRAAEDETGVWAGIRRMWQQLGFLWDDYVLSYDDEMRGRIGAWFGEIWQSVLASLRSAAAAVSDGFVSLVASGKVTRALLYFVLVLGPVSLLLEGTLVVRIVRRARRRRATGRPGVRPADLQFIQRLFDALARGGLAVEEHRTPRQLARRAADTMALPREALDELVDLYYRLRWGGPAATEEEIRAAEEKVAHIRTLLKRAPVA